MFAYSSAKAFLRNILILAGLFLLLPVQTARADERDTPGTNSEWHTVKTHHTVIRYSDMADLFELNKNIQYYPGDTGIKSLMGLGNLESLSDIVRQKIDALFERAQEILDMRGKITAVIIQVYPNQKALNAAYYTIYKEECPLRAWYWFEEKTIYINAQDVHEGMLAHEMGHHIIDHFLKVRPPATTAEILTRYIDAHLYR